MSVLSLALALALLPESLMALQPFLAHQTASTHLHNLLVQRAVQTCCFTSRQCRDNPTAQWLGEFAGHAGLEEFHGIDGLRVQWDEYLAALLAAPEEGITVQSALMRLCRYLLSVFQCTGLCVLTDSPGSGSLDSDSLDSGLGSGAL